MTLRTLDPRTAGKLLEDTLDLLHSVYRRNEIALLWHEGTRAIPTAKGWKPVDSRPDYAGLLAPHGRMVTFDAKACHQKRYHHPKDRGHQLMALWDVEAAGGVAGLLVANLEENRAWWVWPQQEWDVGVFTPVDLGDRDAMTEIPRHPEFWEFMPDWVRVAVKG